MQPSQVKEYFPSVGRSISNAAQLCQITSHVPDNVRDCLSALDRELEQARRMLENEQNDNRIVECIDRLKKLGDRAMHACRQAGNTVDEKVQDAVREAHDAISNLRHRIH